MPDPLDDRYADILAAVGAAAAQIGSGLLTSHWPLVGQHFDHGLLVVGQAVHGWIPDWTAPDAATATGRMGIVKDSRHVCTDRDDPMSWIEHNRVLNSPFWRAAHEVVDGISPGPTPWYSRLAWANLYPVAPNDHKGNPVGTLREVQTAPAASFLDAFIDERDPRLVLVLAGPMLWPFVGPLKLGDLEHAEAPFTLVGRRRGRPWICGMHPGGAQRRGWPARRYAELILNRVAAIAST